MNRWVKALLGIVVVVIVVFVLFTTVFPWFDRTFVNDPVLGATTSAKPVAAAHAG
jgi:quinol-cytochrome oxidoreductase complex cytochrome b subunit